MTPDEAFAHSVAIVLEHEKGLVNNPADPGGVTNYGISIRFAGSINLDLDGDGRTTAADIVAMTPEKAAVIYREHFWEVCRCGELPPALALCVFDGAVNQGPRPAIRLMQRSVGATADGLIGPKTIAAAGRADLDRAVTRFMAKRGKRYGFTSRFDEFGEGWMARLLDVHHEALRLLPRID